MFADDGAKAVPGVWLAISDRTAALGFDMPSDARTGAFLRALAASKPGGSILELGTGTGLATACLLDGMDSHARLISVDNNARCQRVAGDLLGFDTRLTLELADGLDFIRRQPPASFDMIFADAWPGKYDGLDDALALIRPGGFYVGDDMLPQPNWPQNDETYWPADHQTRVDNLVSYLAALEGWKTVTLSWGSGFILAVRAA